MTASLRDHRFVAIDGVRQRAFDLISTNGFNAATVESIAALSSVSPSTVNWRVATKEALVLSTQQPSKLMERVLVTALADRASWR
jgi:AcrR family transcriptional regulator